MIALLEFSGVSLNTVNKLSFSLAAGEIAIVRAATAGNQTDIIDLALGETTPEQGDIHFLGRPLAQATPGSIGWVAAHGGLISNLKIWENVTLPLWYHGKRTPDVVENVAAQWLLALGLEQTSWADFMANSPASLSIEQRKIAGLLRGLVQAPPLLVIEAGLWSDVAFATQQHWNAALEQYVHAAKDRAILVVAEGTISLPWKILKDSV